MKELLDLWAKLTERVGAHVATLCDAAYGISEADNEAAETGPEEGRRKMRKQLAKRRKRCLQVDPGSFEAMIQGL